MKNVIDQFKQAIASAGLTPPHTITDDGLIHRFSTNGKPHDDSGWYVFHTDGISAGAFGNWCTDMTQTWCSKAESVMTEAERQTHRDQIRAIQRKRDDDLAQRQQQAETEALKRWQAASHCTQHNYLTGKGIKPSGAKIEGDNLLIPMSDTSNTLHSLQTIAPDGTKHFMTGGRVKGSYCGIGELAGCVIVCEGFATGATIHEATGCAVAVAFNAGNLEAVARALRKAHPSLKIVVAADDDWKTPDNPGLTKGTAAAQSVAGLLALPKFPNDRPDKATDFNDLHQLVGLDAVRSCIDDAMKSSEEQSVADQSPDTHRNAPQPDPVCLYGLIGDIARAGSTDTEANPFAIAAAMLSYLSAAVGRGPYMAIGDTFVHAGLFMVHVGRSSRGRKGTAKSLVHRIAKGIETLSKELAPQRHLGGLSTREGLALLIHDGYTVGKDEIPPIDDKRLLVVESEFANILQQSKRDGNTLSSALRDAWDGVSIKPAIKTGRVWATDPHLALIGDITPSELRELMRTRELTNGFANRFIFFWAEASKVNPFPKPTPTKVLDSLVASVIDVLKFAGADKHLENDALQMELSPEARVLYEKLYRGELRDVSAGERIAGLLDRRAPVLLRLAMLFALTDQTEVIIVDHINAAMAWVRYWVDSVKFIFQSAVDEAGAAEVSLHSEKIIAFLAKHGHASRTELSKSGFGGHLSKDKLDLALDELLSACPPSIEVISAPRPSGQPGSPTKYYRLTAKSAKPAQSEQPCDGATDNNPKRNVRTQRNDDSDNRPTGFNRQSVFAELAEFASRQDQPKGRTEIQSSQNPLNSPEFKDQVICDWPICHRSVRRKEALAGRHARPIA